MTTELTVATQALLHTKGCNTLRHWLMLLEKPGDWMVFVPAEVRLSAHSIQIYVNALTAEGGPRYAVRNGKVHKYKRPMDEPVYVMRVQPAEE